MFDWPDPTQTSPTSTSAILIVFVPLIVISAAAPGARGWSQTSQRPSGSATVCTRLAAERDAHGFTGIGPAEDARGHVALQQHVVADDPRQADLGERVAGERQRSDEDGREQA